MPGGGSKRILVVDDSAAMRSLLRTVVSSLPGFHVAGTAADGSSALMSVEALKPDLILLDLEMPVMDGLATLKQLRASGHRMPVVMCSSLTQRGARVTLEALAAGASDYVAKPSGQASREEAIKKLARDLGSKMQALTSPAPFGGVLSPASLPSASMQMPAPRVFSVHVPVSAQLDQPQPFEAASGGLPEVLVIGASTGGPAALDTVLSALPAGFPVPVLVVQHMPELFTRLFAERLDRHCRLRVREAEESEPVLPGTIYIARGNWHLEVRGGGPGRARAVTHLTRGSPENHCRPAVDVLFRSASAVYRSAMLAVVLTGMGADGMLGSKLVRDAGGAVIAQDQASSIVWGMPGAVANAGLAQQVLPLDAIAPEVVRLCGRQLREPSELREAV